jgi:hypothetical protein
MAVKACKQPFITNSTPKDRCNIATVRQIEDRLYLVVSFYLSPSRCFAHFHHGV